MSSTTVEPRTTTDSVVELRGVSIGFDGRVVLEDCDLTLRRGELVVLVGSSGSGKSTLLELLIGTLGPWTRRARVRGRIDVLGHRLRAWYPGRIRSRVGVVFQQNALFDELTVRQNVAFGMRRPRSATRIEELLTDVGLANAPNSVSALSGGQKKRLALARSLARDPELMLFDEPTAGLDPVLCRQIAELIRRTHREGAVGRTTLVVTHDFEAFLPVADRVLVLDRQLKRVRAVTGDEDLHLAVAPSDEPRTSSRRWSVGLGWIGTLGLAPLTILRPLFAFLGHPWPSRLKFFTSFLLEACFTPAFFICLAGLIVGGLATYFSLENLPLGDTFQRQGLQALGKVLLSVAIPLGAGILFAARVGAGAAARFGHWSHTRQVDALRMLGGNVGGALVAPLVWSAMLGMPLLTLAACAVGSLASLLTTQLVVDLTPYSWSAPYVTSVSIEDAIWVLFKAVGSGFLVAMAASYRGLAPKASAEDVSTGVTDAIVLASLAVLLWHALLTYLQLG